MSAAFKFLESAADVRNWSRVGQRLGKTRTSARMSRNVTTELLESDSIVNLESSLVTATLLRRVDAMLLK